MAESRENGDVSPWLSLGDGMHNGALPGRQYLVSVLDSTCWHRFHVFAAVCLKPES